MIDFKRIFSECDADTLLVQLLFQRGLPIHCKGIHKVSEKIENFSNNARFVIGVIDSDRFKRLPTYIMSFKQFENKKNDEHIAILHLPETQKYLLMLHPAFEKWILFVAESCNIKPESYGLDNFEKLGSVSV